MSPHFFLGLGRNSRAPLGKKIKPKIPPTPNKTMTITQPLYLELFIPEKRKHVNKPWRVNDYSLFGNRPKLEATQSPSAGEWINKLWHVCVGNSTQQ